MVGTKFKVYMDYTYDIGNVVVNTVIGFLVFIPLYVLFIVIVDAIQVHTKKRR